jgi:ABC-type microcin C transport system permease subunit YejB
VKETDGLGKIQDYHSNMKEAFVRYDDGKPFFRDLKVMEIMEDMEILNNIDKEINAQKMTLPLILSNKKKKTS